MALFNVFTGILFIGFLLSCQNDKKTKKKKEQSMPAESISSNAVTIPVDSSACDTSLWRRVYNPERLQVFAKCITVTGLIEESNVEDDGDQHMLLKLDEGQEQLINKKNKKKKNGDLVIEAVCANNVQKKKVGDVCTGYMNRIQLPKVGDHVKVTGSYVIDTHNGWAEIHPIFSIKNAGK